MLLYFIFVRIIFLTTSEKIKNIKNLPKLPPPPNALHGNSYQVKCFFSEAINAKHAINLLSHDFSCNVVFICLVFFFITLALRARAINQKLAK